MASILVIEDDPSVAQLVQRILKEAGYAVVVAGSAEEGLSAFAEHPFDLIVTDIFLPGETGLDAMIKLKEQQPGLKFVVISGGAADGTFDFLPIAQTLGAKTLSKPFTKSDLLLKVKGLLGN